MEWYFVDCGRGRVYSGSDKNEAEKLLQENAPSSIKSYKIRDGHLAASEYVLKARGEGKIFVNSTEIPKKDLEAIIGLVEASIK